MSQLYECRLNYNLTSSSSAVFNPFTPVIGTICTLLEVVESTQGEGYIFEEVKVSINNSEAFSFDPQYWREITEAPSIDEINQMVEESQMVIF